MGETVEFIGRVRLAMDGAREPGNQRRVLIQVDRDAGLPGDLVIRTPFFGYGSYGMRPCVSRIKPVHHVVDV